MTSEVQALRDAFNRGESLIEPTTDIHVVCDLVKSWFRVLPEPVLPSSSYHRVIEATSEAYLSYFPELDMIKFLIYRTGKPRRTSRQGSRDCTNSSTGQL